MQSIINSNNDKSKKKRKKTQLKKKMDNWSLSSVGKRKGQFKKIVYVHKENPAVEFVALRESPPSMCHEEKDCVFNFYYIIPRYDDIAHFISSSLVAFIAFTIVYILDKYWDGLHMDMYAMAYLVIVTTMAFGVVWEVFEWTSDIITGGHEQWSLNDTMSDLVIDTLGGIVMAGIGILLIKSGRWDRMTEDMGKGIDSMIIHPQKHKK